MPTIASHVANSRISFPICVPSNLSYPFSSQFSPPTFPLYIYIIYTFLPAPSCLCHPPAVGDLHISISTIHYGSPGSNMPKTFLPARGPPVCKNPSVHLLSTFFTTFSEPVTSRPGLLARACVLCQLWNDCQKIMALRVFLMTP